MWTFYVGASLKNMHLQRRFYIDFWQKNSAYMQLYFVGVH